MSETVGIAYIGLGDHRDSHVPFLAEVPGCEVIGVADLNKENLQIAEESIPNLTDKPIFTYNYDNLLDDSRVDAVVIVTGDSTHFRIACDALLSNKHVSVEKPAVATVDELGSLPNLFNLAEENGKRLWVCHPREFGDGPWSKAAQLIGNPALISELFGAGPMGDLRELQYGCHYTLPDKKHEPHASFADDKLNHTIVSVLRTLPKVQGFHNAQLLQNRPSEYTAYLETIPGKKQKSVAILAGGRRSAHKEHHGEGVYREWVEAVFDEGILRAEPTLGSIALMYGKKEKGTLVFDPEKLYDDMFRAYNEQFIAAVRDHRLPESIPRKTKILGTAAAILMQQPGFDGNVTDEAVQRLSVT